ncbi:hypothetical protein D3C78_1095610 [compost metagenome]
MIRVWFYVCKYCTQERFYIFITYTVPDKHNWVVYKQRQQLGADQFVTSKKSLIIRFTNNDLCRVIYTPVNFVNRPIGITQQYIVAN